MPWTVSYLLKMARIRYHIMGLTVFYREFWQVGWSHSIVVLRRTAACTLRRSGKRGKKTVAFHYRLQQLTRPVVYEKRHGICTFDNIFGFRIYSSDNRPSMMMKEEWTTTSTSVSDTLDKNLYITRSKMHLLKTARPIGLRSTWIEVHMLSLSLTWRRGCWLHYLATTWAHELMHVSRMGRVVGKSDPWMQDYLYPENSARR